MEGKTKKSAAYWSGTVAVLYAALLKKEPNANFVFFSRLIDIAAIHYFTLVIVALLNESPFDYHLPSLSGLILPFILFTIMTRLKITARIFDVKKNRKSLFFASLVVALASLWLVKYNIDRMQKLGSSIRVAESPESTRVTPQLANAAFENVSVSASQRQDSDYIQNGYINKKNLKLADLDEGAQNAINVIAQLNTIEPVKDWESFIDDYDSLDIQSTEILNVFIGKAIVDNAPLDVLTDLMSRGATISGDHLSILVANRPLEDILFLENYGFDITLSSSSNTNVYIDSLFNKHRDELFEYFVARQVPLENGKDVDALLKVMERSAKFGIGPRYVEILVHQLGANITEKHIRALENLKTTNPNYYQKLRPLFE